MKVWMMIIFVLVILGVIYVYKPVSHFGAKLLIKHAGGKKIALTFDDGPVPATSKLLDMLDEVGVKATFFVIGEELSRRGELTKKAFDKGHSIGNHSWDHPHMLGWRSESFMKEQIEKTNTELAKLGIKPKSFRAPFGETSWRLTSMLEKHGGMKYVGWTVSSKDWEPDYTAEKIHKLFSNIKENEVILLHDRAYEKPEHLEALKEEILRLKKEGFSFVTIDQLLP